MCNEVSENQDGVGCEKIKSKKKKGKKCKGLRIEVLVPQINQWHTY